jgi:hypothetical protein
MQPPLGIAGLALGALAALSPARADPEPTRSRELVTDDCGRARRAGKTCVLDVPADDITGRVPLSSDLRVVVPWQPIRGSLIRVRRDFLPEIVKAAEGL